MLGGRAGTCHLSGPFQPCRLMAQFSHCVDQAWEGGTAQRAPLHPNPRQKHLTRETLGVLSPAGMYLCSQGLAYPLTKVSCHRNCPNHSPQCLCPQAGCMPFTQWLSPTRGCIFGYADSLPQYSGEETAIAAGPKPAVRI